jgi:hypothetical protein
MATHTAILEAAGIGGEVLPWACILVLLSTICISRQLRRALLQRRLSQDVATVEALIAHHRRRLSAIVPWALDFRLSLGPEGMLTLNELEDRLNRVGLVVEELHYAIARGNRLSLDGIASVLSCREEHPLKPELAAIRTVLNGWEPAIQAKTEELISLVQRAATEAKAAGIPLRLIRPVRA